MYINEEISRDFKLAALKFFTEKLKIDSKVQLEDGAPNVIAGDKVADIFFPKAGIFTLKIKADDTFDYIRELAHEMVHVKQIEDKRLKLINPGIVSFEGQDYPINGEDFKSEESDTPFDKEADAMEKDLASSFWNKLNLKEENITESWNANGFLRPKLDKVSYKYVKIGPLISQNILYDRREIGFIEYEVKNTIRIFQTRIDAEFRKKDIYSNAIIDFVRKINKPIVSDKRNDNSAAVWDNLKLNLPLDMKINYLNNSDNPNTNSFILAPKNYKLNESLISQDIEEELRPMDNKIHFEYLDTGNGSTSQIIYMGDEIIGKIRYDDSNEIQWGEVKKEYRRKDIYSNALIAYVRDFNEPIVSSNRINIDSESVWDNMKHHLPMDMKLYYKNHGRISYYILAPKSLDLRALNEEIIKRSFIKDILTIQQVINLTSSEDVHDVADWLKKPADQVIWQLKKIPANIFEHQVLEMIDSYQHNPKDKIAIQKILRELKTGTKPKPIFVESNDPSHFILEGRHRIVAFFLMDMPMIDVIFVE